MVLICCTVLRKRKYTSSMKRYDLSQCMLSAFQCLMHEWRNSVVKALEFRCFAFRLLQEVTYVFQFGLQIRLYYSKHLHLGRFLNNIGSISRLIEGIKDRIHEKRKLQYCSKQKSRCGKGSSCRIMYTMSLQTPQGHILSSRPINVVFEYTDMVKWKPITYEKLREIIS